MVDAPQPHSLHGLSLRLVEPDRAGHEGDLQPLCGACFCTARFCSARCLLGHISSSRFTFGASRYAPTSSDSSLPRQRATRAGSFRPISPANVARTTLWALAEPSDLVRTF